MSALSRSLRQLAMAGALGLIGACSILPKSQPVQIYLLPSQNAPASRAAPVNWSLQLNTPQTSQVLNSPRIAVIPANNQFSTYAASNWTDPAPRLLRNHLLNAFQADGRVRALSTDDDSLSADFQLGSELLAFQSEYHNGVATVVIRLQAQLIDRNQQIIATRRFEASQPVQGTQVPAVVTAFGQASDQLAEQVLEWVLVQGTLKTGR